MTAGQSKGHGQDQHPVLRGPALQALQSGQDEQDPLTRAFRQSVTDALDTAAGGGAGRGGPGREAGGGGAAAYCVFGRAQHPQVSDEGICFLVCRGVWIHAAGIAELFMACFILLMSAFVLFASDYGPDASSSCIIPVGKGP